VGKTAFRNRVGNRAPIAVLPTPFVGAVAHPTDRRVTVSPILLALADEVIE
jgi:hypothetical protein